MREGIWRHRPRRWLRRGAWLLGAAWLLPALAGASAAHAESVAPIERVRSAVVVRARPSRASRAVGRLRPGERARLLAAGRAWHEVEVDGGVRGYVSARWTTSVPDPVRYTLEASRADGDESLLDAMRTSLSGLFAPPPPVELVIEQPTLGSSRFDHPEPRLPVAGLAAVVGPDGAYDVMLLLDASTSTNEFAESDVDADGVLEDEWKGDDSIYRAELLAARRFVSVLHRLPGNRDGRRIRVGVTMLSGDDSHHLAEGDRDLAPTPQALLDLAHRDAGVRVPLTHDYRRVERELRALERETPSGMTDLAAGLVRAWVELEGSADAGAKSEPRSGAQKVIELLTDGKPRLPYDRELAERAAVSAARLVASTGVRVNAFELGRNAVSGRTSETLRRVARGTRGRFVRLGQPGDVVSMLRGTSFAYVKSVQLVNETAAHASGEIATAIDGSFYGEVPLVEGANHIRVVARLQDDREIAEELRVLYAPIRASDELRERLEAVRRDNEMLVERLREQLAAKMEAVRAQERRRRELELRPDEER